MQDKSPYLALGITAVSDTPNLPAVIAEPVNEFDQAPVAIVPSIAQADTDRELVAMWVGRHQSAHTRRTKARKQAAWRA